MRLYLRAEYQAAINLFRKEGSKEAIAVIDAINAHNASISKQVYNYIQAGYVGYQKAAQGARMIIIHQSSRHCGTIQISHFCLIHDKWEAISHGEATTSAELQKKLLTGKYVNIRRF